MILNIALFTIAVAGLLNALLLLDLVKRIKRMEMKQLPNRLWK